MESELVDVALAKPDAGWWRGKLALCACGALPKLYRVRGSSFGLRLLACEACRITSAARMSDDAAVEQWNMGNRNDKDGNRITKEGSNGR